MIKVFYGASTTGDGTGASIENLKPFVNANDMQVAFDAVLPGEALSIVTDKNVRNEFVLDSSITLNSKDGSIAAPISFLGNKKVDHNVEDSTTDNRPLFVGKLNYPIQESDVDEGFIRVERNYHCVRGIDLCNSKSFISTRVNDVIGLTVEDVQTVNIKTFFDNAAPDAKVNDLHVAGVRSYGVQESWAIFTAGGNLNFEEIHVDMAGMQTGDSAVFKFGNGTNIIDGVNITNSALCGGSSFDSPDHRGDGVVTTRGVKNVTIRAVSLHDFGGVGLRLSSNANTLEALNIGCCECGIEMSGNGNELSDVTVTECSDTALTIKADVELDDCTLSVKRGAQCVMRIHEKALGDGETVVVKIKDSEIELPIDSELLHGIKGTRIIFDNVKVNGFTIPKLDFILDETGAYQIEDMIE